MQVDNAVAEHPLFKQMVAETNKAREDRAVARQLAEDEAKQLRQQQGAELKSQIVDAIGEYEALRAKLHAVVGKIFQLDLKYQNLTTQASTCFVASTFRTINIPTLKPKPNDWSTGFSTTEISIQAFFSNQGHWS